MSMFVVGLDWVFRISQWGYCRLGVGDSAGQFEFGIIEPVGIEKHQLLAGAYRVVLDAPIGLPDDASIGCKFRPCDVGARCWVGASLGSSVFPVPCQGELSEWQRREVSLERQLQGRFRGLIPAIHSAKKLFARYPDKTLESNPELVFAALAGRPLPSIANQKSLVGMLVRLGLMAQHGVTLPIRVLTQQNRMGTADVIDAIAMAVVARHWYTANQVYVIRSEDGGSEPLGACQQDRQSLLALPTDGPLGTGTALTAEELTQIASVWLVENACIAKAQTRSPSTRRGPGNRLPGTLVEAGP